MHGLLSPFRFPMERSGIRAVVGIAFSHEHEFTKAELGRLDRRGFYRTEALRPLPQRYRIALILATALFCVLAKDLTSVMKVMGPLPSIDHRSPLDVRTLEEAKLPGVTFAKR